MADRCKTWSKFTEIVAVICTLLPKPSLVAVVHWYCSDSYDKDKCHFVYTVFA
jgi:hypothetical protein